MTNQDTPAWSEHLAGLLSGRGPVAQDRWERGAQIRLAGEQEPAPLARHHRVAQGDPPTLWIRPIRGHYLDDEDGTDAYDLALARRRGLQFTAARITEDGAVELELTAGGSARIEPAGPAAMAEISRWDVFTLEVLSAEIEAELDALETD